MPCIVGQIVTHRSVPMADAAPDAPSTTTETFSAEYVASLKAELEAAKKAEAASKSKLAPYEARRRQQLIELQPAVQAFIKEGLESSPEFRVDMEPMEGFGAGLHEAANVESAMPLARLISCHSAKIKREREEFSAASGAAEALGKANQEIDKLKADLESRASRITELEGLVSERTLAAERLQEELAKNGLVKEKFDFSNASSREAAPQGESSGATARVAKSVPFVDPLLSFVQHHGSAGTSRIGLSATNHHILGAGGAGDSSIEAALRVA